MLPLVRKWSKIYSSLPATINACCNNTNNKTIYHGQKSQNASTFGIEFYNTGKLFTQTSKQQNFGNSIRAFSTSERRDAAKSRQLTMTKDEINEFMAVCPDVVRDLFDIAKAYELEEAADWYKKALEYNLSITNAKHGMIPVLTYKRFLNGKQATAENLRLAHILGWGVELQHCTFFITDDVGDNSVTRRGKPCWYKLEEVGAGALNDAIMIENGIYELLRKYFCHLDSYVDLVEMFQQNTFKCMSGQSLDMLVSKRNVNTFDMDIYKSIVGNKTSSHFFYMPVALGLQLAGVKDEKLFKDSEPITFEIGNYSQAINDYLDSFGNPVFTGKIGNDIAANKCTWLSVMCMELATPEQKALMEECYGQNDPQKIARVQELYEEMNMPDLFSKYEEETYNKIKSDIDEISNETLRGVLLEILNFVNLRGVK